MSDYLAAKFYLEWGKEKVAASYMQSAYYCYARWGALAKVEDLEKRYPQLLQPILNQPKLSFNPLETLTTISHSSYTSSTSSTSISDALDFTSVLQAAQALSSKIQIDELLDTLNQIILKISGAETCALLLPDRDEWQIRAITHINSDNQPPTTLLQSQPLDGSAVIPLKLVYYVKHTLQTVVIEGGKTDIPGVMNDYMLQHKPQSMLCTPILDRGNLVGILYLEHRSTKGVFTRDRLLVLNFLCTQAAISLENAQLYNYLQDREKFLSSIYEGVGCLIFVADVRDNSRFEYTGWSKSCELAIGIPASEVLGKTPQELLASDEGATVYQKYLRCFQTGIPVTYEESLTFNDQKTWWLTTLSPLKDETGKVYRLVGTTINISDRKQAEEAVTEKSQALATALEDLQQAQLQMIQSEKMSALGNLVAGVAHEINNPVGFISGNIHEAISAVKDLTEYLQLYQEKFPSPGDEIEEKAEEMDIEYLLEDLPKMLHSMQVGCDRIQGISTSLRTFSRADKDYKIPFNIHDGIDSTILILKHRLKANEQRPAIEVVKEYGNLPSVECFPGQLNQVFMNILANGIDALEESNRERSFEQLKAQANCIKIRTEMKSSEWVTIRISDNGQGIPDEIKAQIFNHLFTTKLVGKGTGLGLAIARQIVVEKHGGTIEVNSVLGEGTEFAIAIPLKN